MNKVKLFAIAVAAMLVMFVSNAIAVEKQKIGLVDIQKILTNYEKAAAAQADLEKNQQEMQGLLFKAQKELKNVKSEKVKEKLQKEYAEKIMEKNNSFKEAFSKRWDNVQNTVLSTIKQVADKEGYTLIMDKESVVAGGEDITDKVLNELK